MTQTQLSIVRPVVILYNIPTYHFNTLKTGKTKQNTERDNSKYVSALENIFPNRTDDTFAVNDNAASECDDDDDDGPLNHR